MPPFDDGPTGDFSARDLRGARLAELAPELEGADFSHARLDGAQGGSAKLARARLEQTCFAQADLTGADFSEVEAGQADFSGALLEDSLFAAARLRFARFPGAVLDGANLDGADLWGADLTDAEAQNATLRRANLEEAKLGGATFAGADLEGASLKRASLGGTDLTGANLQGARLDGAMLDGAVLARASLPNLNLLTCSLARCRFAGAWLERTQLRVEQLGGMVGEEAAGEFEAARDSYLALEQNFRSLGHAEGRSWAFRRRRRMGKRAAAARAWACVGARRPGYALAAATSYVLDVATEFLCDYGESLVRVVRAFLLTLVAFAALYWATGSLVPHPGSGFENGGWLLRAAGYLTYSLTTMTTVGGSDLGLHPASGFVTLLTTLHYILGTILLGLFGFVLGAKMSA